MKNIHVLSTDKPSRLHNTFNILRLEKGFELSPCNQNIYITNDEEIKDGEYGLSKLNDIIKFHSGYDYGYYAKIILTTDQDLIKDGVQSIDDEFLEWFVKNPSCEEVEIVKDMELDYPLYLEYSMIYKIIIPKEEPKREFVNNTSKWNIEDFEEPKQETLEEFVESYVNRIDRSEDGLVEQCLRDGAKWQQEQIIDFLHSEITERRDYSASKMCEKVIEFIEQFKNK